MIIGANTSKNFFENLEEEQIQQCGIDLSVWKIFKIEGRELLISQMKKGSYQTM